MVEFKENDTPMLIQFVAGRYEIREYDHPDFTKRFVIAIGRNLEADLLEGSFT